MASKRRSAPLSVPTIMTVCQLISGRFRSRGNQKELCPRAGYGAGDNELMLLRAGEYTSELAKRVEDRRPDLTFVFF